MLAISITKSICWTTAAGQCLLCGGVTKCPLLAGSTYSTSLPDSCRCVFWMAGLETEFHQALLGQKRTVGKQACTVSNLQDSGQSQRMPAISAKAGIEVVKAAPGQSMKVRRSPRKPCHSPSARQSSSSVRYAWPSRLPRLAHP